MNNRTVAWLERRILGIAGVTRDDFDAFMNDLLLDFAAIKSNGKRLGTQKQEHVATIIWQAASVLHDLVRTMDGDKAKTAIVAREATTIAVLAFEAADVRWPNKGRHTSILGTVALYQLACRLGDAHDA